VDGVHGEDCERLRGTKRDRQNLIIQRLEIMRQITATTYSLI